MPYAAKSPQLSRAGMALPVGTIIFAINAERGRSPQAIEAVSWRPVSTRPMIDRDTPPRNNVVLPSRTTPNPVAPDTRAPLSQPTPSRDHLVLAELEADLLRTQRRLKVADAKLSAGQRQLSGFTNALQQAMLEAGPDATGLHPFVRVAKRYAGTPYDWGGESKTGFDCSGFIIVVMRDLGYPPLPHSAAVQFNYGKAIAVPLLKPGDLVFFKGTYKPGVSHVGIYLGRNRFIHAAGTGIGTIVSSLNEAKWRPGGPHYAGARRLIRARG